MLRSILSPAITVCWLAWLAYWIFAARDVKSTRWTDSRASQLLYRVPMMAIYFLLAASPLLPHVLMRRFVPRNDAMEILGTVAVVPGLGYSIWARRHLGRNWSSAVTLKEQHALVRTGPYRHIRHPIYTGILLALLGTAFEIGQWRAVAAVALALFAFVYKLGVEERRLKEAIPEYAEYRRETSALLPFVF